MNLFRLTIFAKSSILDVWQGSEYASETRFSLQHTSVHGQISLRHRTHIRNSHPEVFIIKGALRNFAKLTEKHLCQSLFFNKLAALSPATLLKKSLRYRCFPVNFAKFLRTPFIIEHLRMTSSDILKVRKIFIRSLERLLSILCPFNLLVIAGLLSFDIFQYLALFPVFYSILQYKSIILPPWMQDVA